MFLAVLLLFKQDPHDRIVDELASSELETRAAAESRLFQLAEKAVPALERGRGDRDSEVRARCAQILLRIERHKRAVRLESSLSPGLLRERPDVARRVISDDPATWESLLMDLTGYSLSGEYLRRPTLHDGQGRTCSSTTRGDLRALLSAYYEGPWRSPEVEGLMLAIAGECGVELLRSQRIFQEAFLNSGRTIPYGLRFTTGFGCGTIETAFDRIDEKADASTRDHLRSIHSDERAERVAALVWFLDHSKAEYRGEAVLRLQMMGAVEARKDLIRTLEDREAWVAGAAARALVHLQGPGTFEALSRKAQADSPVRWEALDALEALEDVRALPVFEAALGDPRASVRLAAAAGIRRLGSAGSGEALVPLLEDEDLSVRLEAINALGVLRTSSAAGNLKRRVDDLAVREGAMRALGRLGHADAKAVLLPRLDDLSPETRWEAALAMSLLGDPEALGRSGALGEASGILKNRHWDQNPASHGAMSPERFFVELNRMAHPAATERLFRARLRPANYDDTWQGLLSEWGRQTGFELKMKVAPEGKGEYAFRLGRAREVFLVDELLRFHREPSMTLVLEDEKTIHIVPVEEAVARWQCWKLVPK